MAPRDKRRSRTLWGTIIADPYRKLAAIGLAIALWFFLDQQVTKDQELILTLRAVDQSQSADWRLDPNLRKHLFVRMPLAQVTNLGFTNGNTGEPTPAVTITVRGPSRIVAEIEEHSPSMVAGPFDDLEWAKIDSFTFDVDDISFLDRTLTELRVTMDPGRVRVSIEKNVDRDVPLKTELVDVQFREDTFRDRVREKKPSFSREMAYVNGPESKIDAFLERQPKPFTVELSLTTSEREVSGTLTLNTDDPDLHLRDPPTLTFPLRPNSELFDIRVWVNVDDVTLPDELQGKFVPENKSKMVKIKAGGAVLTKLLGFADWTPEEKERWSKRYLRLVVVIPELREGEQPPPKYLEQAKLVMLDDLEGEDPVNCRLDQPETVTLTRAEDR